MNDAMIYAFKKELNARFSYLQARCVIISGYNLNVTTLGNNFLKR